MGKNVCTRENSQDGLILWILDWNDRGGEKIENNIQNTMCWFATNWRFQYWTTISEQMGSTS